MQLKWLRIRFRGCRGLFRVWVARASSLGWAVRLPCTPVGSRPTAVARGPEGRSGGDSALVQRAYSRPSGGLGATEESRESSRVRRRPLPGRVASVRLGPATGTARSVRRRSVCSVGGATTSCAPVVGAQMAASDPS